MSRARWDGLIFLFLGGLVFLLLGCFLESTTPKSMNDFKAIYYGTKCLLKNQDPYSQSNLIRMYHAEEGDRSADSAIYRTIAITNVYPPSSMVLMIPFAVLHYGLAHKLWMAVIAVGFLLAAFLMWSVGANTSPVMAGCLVGLLLANSELLIFTGNVAGIVIGLSVVAAWCFIHERLVAAGILSMAVSLAFKPQNAGLIWLFFLLAGGTYRKRALQSLVVVTAMAVPTVAWITYLSPHWMQEISSNLLPLSAHGAMNDPGPASSGGHGPGMITDLQTVISVFWDNPRFYNLVSLFICGPLLLIWGTATVRNRPTMSRAWFGLAAIAAFTMLPIYHRQYDAELILLSVPACILAWNRGGFTGRFALGINVVGFVLVGGLPWGILQNILKTLPISNHSISERMLTMVEVFPVPLTLLGMGIFYLWLYIRWHEEPRTLAEQGMELTQSLSPS